MATKLKLKLSIITTLVLTFVIVTIWEIYWRSIGFYLTLDLFFSTTSTKTQPWQWRQSRADYYNNRIYALFFISQLLKIMKADEILAQTKPQY